MSHPSPSSANVARRVPPSMVQSMREALPCQSKEIVMETLGISYNTWLKLKRGESIRSSVAERLMRRFGGDETHG